MSSIDHVAQGERLRSERERLGLSQAEVAKKLRISRFTQIKYEAGARSPDGEYLYRFGGLGADTGYVLFGERSTPNNLYSLGVARVLPGVLIKAGLKIDSLFSILDLAAENEANAWGSPLTRILGVRPNVALISDEKLSSLIDAMFENDKLLDQTFLGVAKMLHDAGAKLPTAKKADIVLLLYDAFKARGKVDKKTLDITVKAALAGG